MYCKNCGSEIDDKAAICPKCGVPVRQINQVNEDDAPSTGFAVLGFFFPLIGLILYLVWKDQSPLKAKSTGKGAIIGVVVGVLLSIVLSICYSCILAGSLQGYYGMISVL